MANETPESDFSIECFQNYSAPEVFVQGLAGMVDQTDVEIVIRAQKNMLQRFEKTTEMLTNCNQLSATRFRAASAEFKRHTQQLFEMKKDLDYIFKKIRAIKTKLSTQYPEAYNTAVAAAESNKKSLDEEEEEILPAASCSQESNLVSTVSTETLKPMTSENLKKSKRKNIVPEKLQSNNEVGLEKHGGVANVENTEVPKPRRNSSSSETESASSGDDTSTDTG